MRGAILGLRLEHDFEGVLWLLLPIHLSPLHPLGHHCGEHDDVLEFLVDNPVGHRHCDAQFTVPLAHPALVRVKPCIVIGVVRVTRHSAEYKLISVAAHWVSESADFRHVAWRQLRKLLDTLDHICLPNGLLNGLLAKASLQTLLGHSCELPLEIPLFLLCLVLSARRIHLVTKVGFAVGPEAARPRVYTGRLAWLGVLSASCVWGQRRHGPQLLLEVCNLTRDASVQATLILLL